MTPTQDEIPALAAGKPPRKAWRSPLRREIVLTLVLKLAVLILIKMMFFSHPASKQESAARLGALIDGGAAPATPSPSIETHKTEQK
ncbi:cytochrome oxidase putative small subunit CydP [Uliginosibacterium sediminicola]|uniref:Cytochrome oxidase putative small subunit CydP n=1 Tax=Uliginosibacterium sediminicola TaxID=2024550 RepID=A0ABU9YZR2_9RHOO